MVMSNLITGFFLIILGLVTRVFKMSFLISGYNTASPEKKARYDEETLVKVVGTFIIILGGILFLGGLLGIWIENYVRLIIRSWVLFSVAVVIGLLYINLTDIVKKKS